MSDLTLGFRPPAGLVGGHLNGFSQELSSSIELLMSVNLIGLDAVVGDGLDGRSLTLFLFLLRPLFLFLALMFDLTRGGLLVLGL